MKKNNLIILLTRWWDWIPTFFWLYFDSDVVNGMKLSCWKCWFWAGWEYRRCGVVCVCVHVMLVCPSLWCLRECLLGLAQWEAVCLFFSHVYPQITSTDSSWQGMHYIHFLCIWHCNGASPWAIRTFYKAGSLKVSLPESMLECSIQQWRRTGGLGYSRGLY